MDATTITADSSGRRILKTGTVMVFSVTGDRTSKVRPASGTPVAADVAGVVMHTTEFRPGPETLDSKDDAPIALFTKNCHFRASKLIGFHANVKTGMAGAGNGRCANNTFYETA